MPKTSRMIVSGEQAVYRVISRTALPGFPIGDVEYRWSSIGYHLQTRNKDNFLSTDFGLREFNVKKSPNRSRAYPGSTP